MRYIHSKGMIYRDLKVDNIMLNSVYQVKLIDFGLVRVNECLFGEEFMKSKSMAKDVGLALFMSPEMKKEEKYDNKTDVFSFFVILYMFIGKMLQTMKEKALGKVSFCLKSRKMCRNAAFSSFRGACHSIRENGGLSTKF